MAANYSGRRPLGGSHVASNEGGRQIPTGVQKLLHKHLQLLLLPCSIGPCQLRSGLIFQQHDGSFELVFLDSFSGVAPEAVDLLVDTSRKIVSSGNGLVFYQNKCDDGTGVICVYNPARRTCFFLPPPYTGPLRDSPCMGTVVKFVDEVLDHELLCVRPKQEWSSHLKCKLYSSRERAWRVLKDIHVGPKDFQLDYLVLCNEIFYLAPQCGPYVREGPYIVFYDVEKECSGVLPMPTESLLDNDLTRWGEDSMCLIQCQDSSVIEVWVLEDYQKASWIRIQKVSLKTMGLDPQAVQIFTVLNSNTLAFATEDRMYAYDLEDGEVRKLGKHRQGWYPKPCPYANTLRSCGRVEGTLIKAESR